MRERYSILKYCLAINRKIYLHVSILVENLRKYMFSNCYLTFGLCSGLLRAMCCIRVLKNTAKVYCKIHNKTVYS